MKSLKNLLSVAAGFFLLVACNAERESIPAEELYYRNFIKKYGLIDTDHNWSLATNQNITVKGARGKDVKIYADFSGKRHLVADYSAIADNATLTFDVPAEVKTVIARVGATSYTVNIGETLNASGSREIIEHPEGQFADGFESKIEPESVIEVAPIKDYFAQYPEAGNNLIANGINSFYFIADGQWHTFYPFYWQTSDTHMLGIYTIDESVTEPNQDNNYGVVFHDLYRSKSGELYFTTEYNPPYTEQYICQAGETRQIEILQPSQNGTNHEGIYTNPECTEFNVSFTEQGWLGYLSWTTQNYTEENAQFYISEFGYVSQIYFDYNGNKLVVTETFTKAGFTKNIEHADETVWQAAGFSPSYEFEPKEGTENQQIATHVKTRGVSYRLPEGTKYGFYIKCKYSNNNGTESYDYVMFSQSSRNENYGRTYDEATQTWASEKNQAVNGRSWQQISALTSPDWWTEWNKEHTGDERLGDADKFAFASWMTVGEHTFFGFEDWPDNTTDFSADLNDLMFMFKDGNQPGRVVDEKDDPEDPVGSPVTWTIAVEDLGETDDYDFNDLVLSIEYVSGQRTATFKALAAGGVYPIYVKYRDKLVDASHVNVWLGETDHTKMINTYEITKEHKDGFTIDLDEADTSINDILDNLTILVYAEDEDNGGEIVREIQHLRSDENHPENCGKAPLMILVKEDWEWPVERTDITNAYPHFKEWVGNREITDWYEDKQYTVPRKAPASN